MIGWSELLIGLMPFTLVALLLWMRLSAAGVSNEVAVKFIVKVLALVAIAIIGFWLGVKGWREKNTWLLALGAIAAGASIFNLRWNLQRMWEKFPLPSNGSEQSGGNGG
ncbi:MAG: hypothetical protein ACK40X_00830 [Armatimonadota bacterium]